MDRLAATSSDLEGASSDQANALATAEDLAATVQRLEAQQTDLTAELATANGDLAEATGDRDNVQAALEAAENEREALRVTAASLQAALDALALQGARSLLSGRLSRS